MMTFCQKNVHSFLGFSNTKDNGTVELDSLFDHHQNSTMKSPLFSPPFSISDTMMTTTKRDPGGIGFIDDVGGSVDGLMSCTESLGFESSDERRVDDQIESLNYEMCNSGKESTMVGSKWKRERVKREVKKFPPPLSSLDQNGKPTFFLRPVRKDGKLELQEVKISRPEILRASRQDGRLRLHLVTTEDEYFEEQYEEEKEEEEEIMQEIEEDVQEMIEREMEAGMEGYTEEEEVEGKEEERVEGWQIPVSPGSGEGFRRCYDQVSHHQNHHQHGHHHHHHELHVWSQHCVTIR